MNRCLVALLFMIFYFSAAAQVPKLIFDHFGPENGFNSRTCRTVQKTADGMIWVTTSDGLAGYDSKKFRFFQHDPADSLSITSNSTDQLAKDKRGNLWVVAGSGLDIFDPQTETFRHCFIRMGNQLMYDFNPESLFYDVLYDRVWIGTWKGLYYAEAGSPELKQAKANTLSGEIAKMVFISITRDSGGYIWLCNAFGFFKYEPGSGQFTQYHVPDQDDLVPDDDGAFCIFADNGGILWIGTWTKGLVRYNTRNNTGRHYYYLADYKKEQNGIVAIAKTGLTTEKDIIWLSTTSGLAAFNTLSGTFHFYTSKFLKDKNGIRGKTNRLLPVPAEGMWIASEDGLHLYDYSKQLFSEIDLAGLNPGFQNAEPVEHLTFQYSVRGEDSVCWFNVPYLGTYYYKFGENKLYRPPETIHQYLHSSVYNMYIDKENVLWAATDQYGLVGISLITQKPVLPAGTYFTKDWQWVTGFCEGNLRQLWLATYKGLFLYDRDTKKMEEAVSVNAELERLGLALNIEGMAKDNKGRIWFTSSGVSGRKDAIGVYDMRKKEVQIYSAAKNAGDGFIPEMKIGNIAAVNDKMFVATESGLLCFSNTASKPVFQLLTTKNGLVNNRVQQVLPDKEGAIWCAGEFGVSRFMPEKNFFMNYLYTTSGIGPQNKPFMHLSAGSGNLYVCQQGSVNVCIPSAITVAPAPNVHFTALNIFNKAFKKANKQLKPGEVIRLRHNQNMVSVEFAAMSFSNAADNQYAYRLQGLEDDWIISRNNIASYNNLAPGKYTLWVKAANSSGVWTPEPVSLIIIISPPFWKTWWFIALIALAVTTLLYALYRYRINQLTKMHRLRNTISRNLHDEIGSTLTSISILSSVSQQAMDKDPVQAREMLQKIANQSKTIQQNMSDIVWAIRSDNDKLEDLLVRMREYAAQTMEPLLINTSISINESLPDKALPLEARKDILLIYKEALNNIVKHAGASNVVVSLQQEAKQLILSISDNGQWKGAGKKSGTGIGSMQQRAEGIGGKFSITHSAEGTRVLVMVPVT